VTEKCKKNEIILIYLSQQKVCPSVGGKFICVMNPQNQPSVVQVVQGKTQVAKGTTLISRDGALQK
jgi:hypothetical protein